MFRTVIFLLTYWSGVMTATLLPAQVHLLAATLPAQSSLWTGVLTVALSAFASGAWAGGKLTVRAPSVQKMAAVSLVGAWTMMPMTLVATSVVGLALKIGFEPFTAALASAALLVFVPLACAGVANTFATRLLTGSVEHAGERSGAVTGLWCAGAALGTYLAHTWLREQFDIRTLLWIVIALEIAIALPVLGSGRRMPQ